MFQRHGSPIASPNGRGTASASACARSRSHRPSACRRLLTMSTASSTRGSGSVTGGPEVVERAEDVVLVARRERESQERRARNVAGRAPPEETPLEQILLASSSCRGDFGRGAGGALVLEQPLEDANRRVKRRARALRRLAVPPAVLELLAEKTAGEAFRRMSEVRAKCERAAVDARLDLAFEERLRAELLVPAVAGLQPRDRGNGPRIGRVDARRAQELHA